MEWIAYGEPRTEFASAKQLAHMLTSFKTGVKVIKYGTKWLVFTYDKPTMEDLK